jgi:hypothetical protein
MFTAAGKLKKFLLKPEMFDVCTTRDTAHIDKIFKFLTHTRQRGCIYAPMLTRVWQELEYRIDVCRVTRGAYIEHL